MAWQDATIRRVERRSPTVSSFFLSLAAPFRFRPGQHVTLRLTAPDGYTAQRSYSIASAPEAAGELELAIERFPDGEVSTFLHDVAEIGDTIELSGPIGGHFVWTAQAGGPVLLVAAGSGVVPFVSMARHRAATGSEAPMLLLFSARTRADLLFAEELLAMQAAGDGFSFVPTFTRERVDMAGAYSRRIDAAMIAQALARLPGPVRAVYVCGSNGFVDVATDAVIAGGVEAARVRTERYGV